MGFQQMVNKTKKKQLGRGLASLLGEESQVVAPRKIEDSKNAQETDIFKVPIENIEASKIQPRKQFQEEEILALSKSIENQGILQPILVRKHTSKEGKYEIIAGERRWRAAQIAKAHDVPVVLKDLDDRNALEISLMENLQRQDLNPLEESEGYLRLVEDFGNTQEEIADRLGKSRSHVANMLRLTKLPFFVQELLRDKKISTGHAKVLLASEDPEGLAKIILEKNLSVRETERMSVKTVDLRAGQLKHQGPEQERDANILSLEKDISNLLGVKTVISYNKKKGGKISLFYKTLDQLDGLLSLLREKK
jgi:ParB family chromosome partitioning protein